MTNVIESGHAAAAVPNDAPSPEALARMEFEAYCMDPAESERALWVAERNALPLNSNRYRRIAESKIAELGALSTEVVWASRSMHTGADGLAPLENRSSQAHRDAFEHRAVQYQRKNIAKLGLEFVPFPAHTVSLAAMGFDVFAEPVNR